MCYRPLHLTNRTLDFNPDIDKVRYDVPCGHCGECINQKREDWRVRTYYEYLDTKRCGGRTIFVTLTYNKENVPVYDNKLCFSKKHIQLFNKRVRNELKRQNIYLDYKYLVTSEYGGQTKRPHYHALLFFKGYVSIYTIRSLIRDCWSYGFVKFGDNLGEVYGNGACKYVTKYITKDIDFLQEFKYIYDAKDIKLLEKFKQYQPFHMQSQGLGIYALEVVPKNILEQGRIYVPSDDPNKCYVRIPLYFDRKLFFDVDLTTRPDSPRYVLNGDGINMKKVRLQLNSDKLVNAYRDIIFSSISDADALIPHINKYASTRFNNFSHFQDHLRDLLGNHTLDELVSYSLVYRDRIADTSLDSFSICVDNACDCYQCTIETPKSKTNLKLQKNYADYLIQNTSYNQLDFFQDFDSIIELLSTYKLVQGIFRQKEFDKQRLYYSFLKTRY